MVSENTRFVVLVGWPRRLKETKESVDFRPFGGIEYSDQCLFFFLDWRFFLLMTLTTATIEVIALSLAACMQGNNNNYN